MSAPRAALRPLVLRIGPRLLLAFLVVGLVPLLVLGWITARQAEDTLREHAIDNLETVADQRAARLEAFVRNRVRDATLLARVPGVADALRQLDVAFHEGGLDSPAYREVDRRVRPFLTRAQEAHDLSDLLLIAPSGDVVFSVRGGADLGASVTTGPYERSALAEVFDRVNILMETTVSDYDRHPGTKQPAFFTVAPVFADSAIAGVLAVRVDQTEINRLVHDYSGLGASGEIVLGKRRGDHVVMVAPSRHDPNAAFQRSIAAGSEAGRPLWQACRGKRGIGTHVDYRGEEVVTSWRYVPYFGWGMVVKLDASEAFAPSRGLAKLWLVGGSLGLALVVVVSMLFARTLSDPIRRLSETTRLIAAGELERRVDVQRRDELGDLARSFNDMADEILAARDVLEDRVRRRTTQLEEHAHTLEEQRDSIRQKNAELTGVKTDLEARARELERAGRYKSEFLANMSHELRTPLNSLLILSKLLADNRHARLSHEEVQWARTIHSSGSDLLALINDVLDVAKVEAGRMEIHPEPIDLREVAAGLRASFDQVAREQGLGFEVEVRAGAQCELAADPHRLNQIARNLVSNALKFTERGEVTVLLEEDDDGMRLTVTDTGPGIAEDRQALIFESFRQGEGSISRQYGGTGLGLSISRQLARLMGGDLTVKSVLGGGGSTFMLQLPLRPAASRAPAKSPPAIRRVAPAPPKTTASASSHRPPILIIEDDPRFAKVLTDLVRERGLEPLVTEAGEEGLRLAAEHTPLGIMLDLHLPGMDGWQVIERLKEDPRTSAIPVHVLSGDDDVKNAVGHGAIGWLLKPTTRDQLTEALERLRAAGGGRTVRRVLVVEDDPVQQLFISELLAGLPVEVILEDSGEAALERLSRETFDCMILDLVLPDITGFEVLSRLAEAETPVPPVIVHTARELTEQDEARLRRVVRAIIRKGGRGSDRLLEEATLFLGSVYRRSPAVSPSLPAVAGDAALEGRTVLLVDDDIRNVYALRTVLEGHGLDVVVARNGREGIEKLHEHADSVDLVLMDIMMPEMDGLEATRRIRAEPRFAQLPILAVTAKAMKGDAERCAEAGTSDHLPKPVEPDQLLSLLRVWLPRTPA